MPRENILYMRGSFPFSGISSELVADAKVVFAISFEQLNAIANELNSFPRFLDKAILRKIIGSFVPDEEPSKRLTRLILGVDSFLYDSGKDVLDLLARLEEWQGGEENQESKLLSQEEMGELRNRLPLIIKQYPGLARQAKAEYLSESTGLRLENLEIICDLRPVFDESRSIVEGIIPFTTLKIVCKGVDGLPVSLEAILAEDEVSDLVKKADAAIKKLTCLRAMLAANHLPIPSVELTKHGK